MRLILALVNPRNTEGNSMSKTSNAPKPAPAAQGITPKDNAANIGNANKGSPGTNRQYDQSQGNRGTQLNPNRKP